MLPSPILSEVDFNIKNNSYFSHKIQSEHPEYYKIFQYSIEWHIPALNIV